MLKRDKDRAVILYFIGGSVPTEADNEALDRLTDETGAFVRFRNGMVDDNDTLEICNGVAGDHIPPRYLAAYPVVDNNGVGSIPLETIRANEEPKVSASIAAEVGNANEGNPQQQFGGFGGFTTGN